MPSALHALLYAEDAVAARAFFRDVLRLPNVDAGMGWLIFGTGPSEVGIHPGVQDHCGATWTAPHPHEITLVCDDIEAEVATLRERGAEFTRDVRDDGWGLTTMLKVPGAGELMLYQPRHPVAYDG
ncbi:MAG: VOC family protein [Dermatophilaceae bacterium]